ncbi:hypothetical protein [Paracandidimonas soli]|uniref:Uncharacterized protein n=1 Tax=Paracandidimonas soli TaxID=1917182 RepID=A0A4R3UM23_9BURK|nr:hypothetical protein [Paracandidimonas soli]TCU91631.1 hypothetical protein EV686_11727 [Paracandidimonas soli]
MLKRLYKRFLEWALAPVLRPVTDELGTLQSQAFVVSGEVAILNQAMVGEASIRSSTLKSDDGKVEVDFPGGRLSMNCW